MAIIEWTAYNDTIILATTIKSSSLKKAICDSREYLESELKGEGTIRIYKDGTLLRVDRKSKRANYTTYKPRLIPIKPNKWWDI